MMGRKPNRQESNHWALSLMKAGILAIFLGGISFVGTWAVGLQSTVAAVRDDVQSLKEKERLMSEMVYPQLMEQTKELKMEIRELRNELKQQRRK